MFFCLISLVSSFAKEETRETRRKENKEERAPQSRWAFWRNGSFASSAQTVSRLLGETAGRVPSANPTVPDLLVSSDGGVLNRLFTARREGSGICLCSGRPLVAPTLFLLVRQVGGADSAAVRFAAVSIVRLQKGRCSADVFARFWGTNSP